MSSAHTGGRSSGAPLPLGFRKHDLSARRREVKTSFAIGEEEWEGLSASTKLLSIADVMVESVVGCVPIPLGIADGFLIDGEEVAIPMAVEEPSVIAAASFAAWLVRPDGGFTTWASPPLMTAQVFLEGVTVEGERSSRPAARAFAPPSLPCSPPWRGAAEDSGSCAFRAFPVQGP